MNFRSAGIVDAIETADLEPDIVTLQEVTNERAAGFIDRLKRMKLVFAVHTGDAGTDKKRYGNLIASRWPIEATALASVTAPPFPQLVGRAVVAVAPELRVDVLTVHAPNGSGNGWDKIHTLEAVRSSIERAGPAPRIVTGDFNEPMFLPDVMPVRSWARKDETDWALRADEFWTRGNDRNGEESYPRRRWDDAVRWYFDESSGHDLRHTYWERHGAGTMEPSHLTTAKNRPERWFDHAFVSSHFDVVSCTYRHDLRRPIGPSDHSALWVELDLIDSMAAPVRELRVRSVSSLPFTDLVRGGGGEGFGIQTAMLEGEACVIVNQSALYDLLEELEAEPAVLVLVFKSVAERAGYLRKIANRHPGGG